MAFATPITIKEALSHIERNDYLLPGIQREFVWAPEQICRLFDSLLRGYPIGSFLFWKVDREHSGEFTFYDFMLNYHEKNAPHCPRHGQPVDRGVTAILDGQQRLTALNIGLRGSHAEKKSRLWWNNPDAFPVKKLYLNLLRRRDGDESGLVHDFQFREPSDVGQDHENGDHWFPVSEILGMKEVYEPGEYCDRIGLGSNREAKRTLAKLQHTIHSESVINFYEEEGQDLNKVLDIFIRLNSAGMPLSRTDMLLSIATAQWKTLDARQTIHDFVDTLNGIGHGFRVTNDLVLQAGLVLTDVGDIGFKVTNFNNKNMLDLESRWEEVSSALQLAVRLLSSFGFSDRTLSAYNVLIPVAYYLARRSLGLWYLTSAAHADDRKALRDWVIRSLVKPGIWGSAVDTLLTALRRGLRDVDVSDGFPTESLERAMPTGKSLRFEEGDIHDLVDTQSISRSVFPILALLYPHKNFEGDFDIDHIFPKSRFTDAQLRVAGVTGDLVEEFRQRVNGLPNLALLERQANLEKSKKLPADWVAERYPDAEARAVFLRENDMQGLPADMGGFLEFYDARRERIAERMRALLSVAPAPAPPPSA